MLSSKKFTARFLPIVAALLIVILAACGSTGGNTTPTNAHTPAAQNKQVLVSGAEAGVADIRTFDPALSTDAFSIYAIDNVFTGLVQLDDKLNVQPQLAQSYQIMPGGTTYKFTLRPGLKFSDGTPLTSADVVYSINRALDPATNSPTGPYYLHYIKDSGKLGVKNGVQTLIGDSLLAPDPNTVEIITDKPYSFFLDALTYPCSYVVEKSLITKYGKNWTDHLTEGGGAGPWQVKEYTHNKQIVFVPNPNYYGPKPRLRELIYPFYQSAPTVYQAYLANQVDDTYVPSQYYRQDKSRPDFHQIPVLAINYYTMNYLRKPFDNIKIRQAFELAINKDLIVSKIWQGQFIATNHIIPQGQPGYNPNLTGPDGTKSTAGNPTLAKQLLQQGMQEDGYSSVAQLPPITLTYSSGGDQASKNEVAALQQMWQNVLGISVKTNDIDFNTLIADETDGANNPLMFYSGPAWIADYPDPQDWTTLQFDKGVAQNGMNYGQNNSTDAAAQQANQRAMEAADVMPMGQARLQAYMKIEQELVDEVAWLPMEQQIATGLRKPCVQGVVENSAGVTPPNDWANIYISTDTPCVNATVQ
jgi:oligopeptide transport system substrate-binding protein